LVGVLPGPALALLGDAEMHVGVDEPRQQPAAGGVDDLGPVRDLELRSESGEAAVPDQDGAVEGVALDRDDMGVGDRGESHAMTFRRPTGGVKSPAAPGRRGILWTRSKTSTRSGPRRNSTPRSRSNGCARRRTDREAGSSGRA